MENNQQGQKNNKLWMILFLVSAALNVYLWMNKSAEADQHEVQRDEWQADSVNYEKEIAQAMSDIEAFRGQSESLDSLLNEANAKIAEQAKKLKVAKGNSDKMKKELEELRAISKEYLERIEALIEENQSLKTANSTLEEEKKSLTYNVASLTKNLESTVQTASALKAEYIKINMFKRKSNGKYIITALAKRTNKMEVCFDIMDNKIAKAGQRNVYVRITEPGGKTIGNRSSGSGEFTNSAGESVMYSATTTVDYTGAKANICVSHEEKDDKMFAPGTYLVEVYIDKDLAGAGSAVLK